MAKDSSAKRTLAATVLLALLILCIQVNARDAGLREESGYNHVWLKYTLDSGLRRNTLTTDDFSLKYNIRTGLYPHAYDEDNSRQDMMIVQTPPYVDDDKGWFNYSYIKGEVAWSALSVNFTQENATLNLERTVDLTNTDVVNLTRYLNLTYNYVEVDTAGLSAFDKEAKITLRNLEYVAISLKKDGVDCTDCTLLGYSDGIAIFNVDPTLLSYWAENIGGWVNWDVLDIASVWVGSEDSKGFILVGPEDTDQTYRQYYSSNATDSDLAPKIEINYTIRDQLMYSNQTLTDVFDLDDYFWDAEGDPLTYLDSDDHPDITVTIGADNTVDMKPENNYVGTQYVVFNATDGSGITTSNNVTLTVLSGVTTTTTVIVNNDPIVRHIEAISGYNDDIVLFPGTYKNVTYNASLTDDDGCAEITTVKAVLWDTVTASHSEVGSDGNDLYKNDSCEITCDGNSGHIECGFNVLYWAQPSSTWAVNISAYDDTVWSHNTTTDLTVAELVAINISDEVDFAATEGASMDLGDTSSADTELKVQNFGNVELDLLVSGTDMPCDQAGSIPVGNIKYDSTSGQDYDAAMCTLTANDGDTCADLDPGYNLAKSTDGTISEDTVYWKIRIPATGAGGACEGTLTASGQKST